MLTDRGASAAFAPAELEAAWLEGCDWLHVSGYCLAAPPLCDTAAAAARLASHVSVDLASTAAIEAAGARCFAGRVVGMAPEVVFATEAELELVAPLEARTIAVKRGPRGCVVLHEGSRSEHAARPATAVDTTGAGDAFAAGFLLGGAELALEAAARCVSRLGAMPT